MNDQLIVTPEAEKKIFEEFQKERECLADLMAILRFESLMDFSVCGTDHLFLLQQKISNACTINHTDSGLQITLPACLSAIADCEFDELVLAKDAILLLGKAINTKVDQRIFQIALYAGEPTLHSLLSQNREVVIGFYESDDYEILIRSKQSLVPKQIVDSFYPDISSDDAMHLSSLTLSSLPYMAPKELGLKWSDNLKSALSGYSDQYDPDPIELGRMNAVLRGYEIEVQESNKEVSHA